MFPIDPSRMTKVDPSEWKEDPPVVAVTAPELSAAEKAHVAAVVDQIRTAKVALADADMEVAQAEGKRHQERLKVVEALKELHAVGAMLTKNHGVDTTQWVLDVDTGTFVARK